MKKKEEKTDMSEFTLIVGKRIRKARKAKDLTLEELAERCGLHPAYIGQLERGVKNASLYTLEKIACALELSLTDLVGNSDIVTETAKTNIPADCRSIICTLPPQSHELIYALLKQIINLERGERNATIATLESVSYALNVPIERFVEYITPGMASQETAANECYNLILEQTPRTQKRLLAILQNMAQLHQIQ